MIIKKSGIAMDSSPKTKRVKTRLHSRRYCEHCSCFVSKSTWYNHQAHVSSRTEGSGTQSIAVAKVRTPAGLAQCVKLDLDLDH